MPYSSGDLVTVDGVEYTVSGPADAYTVVDSDGNEMVMTMAQLEGAEESEPEELEMPATLKDVKPADRSKVKAAMAKAAFGG